MSERSPVRREDWMTLPMSAARRRLDVTIALSADERARVERGHLPRQMEDKWFAFVEAGRLCLCRSWTGIALFEATLSPAVNAGDSLLGDVVATADASQFTADDAAAADLFERVVRDVLLADSDDEDDAHMTVLP